MFERFDDPAAFRPDAEFRAGVHRRAGALRRRRRVLAAGGDVAGRGRAVGGAGLYVDRRDDAIDRIEVTTEPSTDGATNVLLIGTDGPLAEGAARRLDRHPALRRDRAPACCRSRATSTTPSRKCASTARSATGPRRWSTPSPRSTGIPIDHYVAIEPQGFADLVDAVGGLAPRRAPAHCSTTPTGLDARARTSAPCSTATRRWRWPGPAHVGRPTGDLGRDRYRQQAMLGAALDQLDADPATIDRLSRLLADHAVVDDGLDLAGLVGLGTRLATGPPLRTEVLPVSRSRLAERRPGARARPRRPPTCCAAYGATTAPTSCIDQPGVDVTTARSDRGEAPPRIRPPTSGPAPELLAGVEELGDQRGDRRCARSG